MNMKLKDIELNENEIIEDFISLAKVSGVSYNEKHISSIIESRMRKIGAEIKYDHITDIIGGNTDNMLATISASNEEMATAEPILFCEHIDTVEDTKNLTVLRDGDYLRSDGTTILGADNRGAITSILNALEYIYRHNIPHRTVEILFTVAEELSLMGSSSLDYSMFQSKMGVVIDGGGKMGKIYKAAPEHYNMSFKFYGKGAHAGMSPENGINAISMAAKAVCNMPLGRIDIETTANIGIINGGNATNVVPDYAFLKGEVRSREKEKTKTQMESMKQAAINAADAYSGWVEIETQMMYPSFSVSTDHSLCQRVIEIFKDIGVEAEITQTGGGSDANYLNNNGIYTILLSAGYENAHSKEEKLYIPDLINFTKFIIMLIT